MIMVFKFLGQDLYLKKDLYGNFFSIVRFIYVKMFFFYLCVEFCIDGNLYIFSIDVFFFNERWFGIVVKLVYFLQF